MDFIKKHTLTALLSNILLLFILFTVTRLVFVACNTSLYADHLNTNYLMQLLAAGIRFDCSAILYLNCWLIVGFLLPFHKKEEAQRYYMVLKVIFVVVNSIALAANLCDCAYFPFTGRRTTWSVISEFSNEGNFLTIIMHECLPYWYLFFVAMALVWILWKGFVMPKTTKKENTNWAMGSSKPKVSLRRYYICMPLALIIAAALTVAGMRGGFTKAVRPITMSNANQYVEHAIDAGIVLNTPFCIFRSMGHSDFAEPKYMSMEEAEKLYTPLHQPSDSTEFKNMNVVILILESFGKQTMARGYMPFVEELSKKALSFEYSYATGRKSIDGMPSVLASIPSFVEPFFLTSASLNDLSGIAGELSRNKGYTSAFFHGAENGSMGFQAFAKSSGFQKYYGRTEYNQDPRYHGDDDFDGTWAIWDEEFLQYYCDKMTEMKQPFVTSVFTASSHSPYDVPKRYEKRFPPTDPGIFAVTAYSDNAVKLFFEKAEKQPWYENTLFVLTADHAQPYPVDPTFKSDIGRYKVPVVFFAPGHPELMTGVNKDKIICQADIMPTVLGFLGYDRPYIAFGEDVIHTDAEKTCAFNYLNESSCYQYLQGDWMLQFDGEKVVHSYKFKEDSLLVHDMKDKYPKEYEKRMKSIIQQYMFRMNHNQLIVNEKK